MIIELGEIQGTEYNCLVVERGLVNKNFFYIPKDLVENYDGKTVTQTKITFLKTPPNDSNFKY